MGQDTREFITTPILKSNKCKSVDCVIQQKFTESFLVTADFDEIEAMNINKAKVLLWKYFICQRDKNKL